MWPPPGWAASALSATNPTAASFTGKRSASGISVGSPVGSSRVPRLSKPGFSGQAPRMRVVPKKLGSLLAEAFGRNGHVCSMFVQLPVAVCCCMVVVVVPASAGSPASWFESTIACAHRPHHEAFRWFRRLVWRVLLLLLLLLVVVVVVAPSVWYEDVVRFERAEPWLPSHSAVWGRMRRSGKVSRRGTRASQGRAQRRCDPLIAERGCRVQVARSCARVMGRIVGPVRHPTEK